MKLPNGHEAVGPLVVPDDWWLGVEKVICGCNQRIDGIFAFIKYGKLWIRVRHTQGAGFCEFEAISDEQREARAGRIMPFSLRSH